MRNVRNIFVMILGLLILSPIAFSSISEAAWKKGSFEVYIFDMGQADSQFVVGPTGRTLLIDAGEVSPTSSAGSAIIASKIRDIMGKDFSRIDYIVATHLHTDHIGAVGKGGIWALIEKHGFTAGKLVERNAGIWEDLNKDGTCDENAEIKWFNVGTLSGTARKWICYSTDPRQVKKFSREVAIIGSKVQIDLGPDVEVTIVHSDAQGVMQADKRTPVAGVFLEAKIPPSENDYSITLTLRYKNFTYLTGGDTDGEYALSTNAEKYSYNDVEAVVGDKVGAVNVLRVNHHGSAHSTSDRYLEKVKPQVAVISCGPNSYGHPSQKVLDALNKRKINILTTGKCESTRTYGAAKVGIGDVVILQAEEGFQVNGKLFKGEKKLTESTSTFKVLPY